MLALLLPQMPRTQKKSTLNGYSKNSRKSTTLNTRRRHTHKRAGHQRTISHFLASTRIQDELDLSEKQKQQINKLLKNTKFAKRQNRQRSSLKESSRIISELKRTCDKNLSEVLNRKHLARLKPTYDVEFLWQHGLLAMLVDGSFSESLKITTNKKCNLRRPPDSSSLNFRKNLQNCQT